MFEKAGDVRSHLRLLIMKAEDALRVGSVDFMYEQLVIINSGFSDLRKLVQGIKSRARGIVQAMDTNLEVLTDDIMSRANAPLKSKREAGLRKVLEYIASLKVYELVAMFDAFMKQVRRPQPKVARTKGRLREVA